MGSIRDSFVPFVFFLFAPFLLFAQNEVSKSSPQNSVSLASEISRLEKLGTAAPSSQERYNAFLGLVRLHQLSGNPEAAVRSCERALAAFPGDGRFLLQQARFLISLGEYEKASAAINALLSREREPVAETPQSAASSVRGSLPEKELLIQGQYLSAQLEAFRSNNTRQLAGMVTDPDFAAYLGGIYYTLWKLTGLSSWKTRLAAEFPQSPEAKIANAAAGVNSAPTPLWLLFPGRDSIVLSGVESRGVNATPAAPAASTSPTSPVSPSSPAVRPPQTAAAAEPAAPSTVLQIGLFSREENARAMADRITKSGFAPQISRRQVNGNNFWAVSVPPGTDMNVTIKKLKDAGFDSFPVKF